MVLGQNEYGRLSIDFPLMLNGLIFDLLFELMSLLFSFDAVHRLALAIPKLVNPSRGIAIVHSFPALLSTVKSFSLPHIAGHD